MLRTRIYTVLVVLPLFLAALFFTAPPIWALLLVPGLIVGALEWGMLAGWPVPGRALFAAFAVAGSAMLWYTGAASAPFALNLATTALTVSALFWLLVAPLWLARAWRMQSAWLLALTGLILLLPLWLALVRLQTQPVLLLVLMAIVWISDTAAYFAGHRWGKRKLAVSISPGKTWEGVLGAIVTVVLYCMLVNWSGLAHHSLLRGVTGCVIFLLLMALGIEGDLFESWIKRTAGVKDSGNVLPGHGGVLDRVDALTASMPAAALLLSAAT